MKKSIILQQCLWVTFVLYYTATKYLAANQGWNFGYALQVGLILTLTCLLPYYLTTVTAKMLKGSGRYLALTLMPCALALSGYATFFLIFIQPNFPNITAWQVIPRGLFPGVVISALLIIPDMAIWWRTRKSQDLKNAFS